ncbi:MAG TPA: penicillin acylase family protein, partial [Anaerolineae bacterium]|nr:penicillin acylase family protein [Anaerolineae bacterium]
MNRALQVIAYIFAAVFVLLLVVIGALLLVQRRPLPQTDGSLTVAGLKDEVTIYRDEYGIPHIYANSLEDLVFAQGYVHAQD